MKDKIPSYTKIITLGSSQTENALVGEVIVQEKVDGSQFKFGRDEDGQLLFASKGCKLIPIQDDKELINIQKMFRPAVKYLLSIEDILQKVIISDTYCYAETLETPKHNVLKYDKVPTNHIVLFDIMCQGGWLSREIMLSIALYLNIDFVPELYKGEIERKRIDTGAGGYKSSATDFLKRIIETTPSYLGGTLIEGVVIKNYTQNIMLGGQVFPLFTKYVREAFKEKHDAEWKIKRPKDSLEEYIKGFQSEARWQKAIIHLKEQGLLENQPKDIGILIKTVQKDILEEEKEDIMKFLYNKFKEDILRNAVRGLPEYYKQKLLDNLK
jgi:hypothetical protein